MPQHAIVGTWALVSSEWKRADDLHANPFGAGSTGVLMYDASAHMSAQIMHADRPPVANAPSTIDVAFAVAIPGYLAYFGTYEVDEAAGAVSHNIIASSFPAWVGESNRRRYSIEGDTLTLRDDLTTADGIAVAAATVWRRVT